MVSGYGLYMSCLFILHGYDVAIVLLPLVGIVLLPFVCPNVTFPLPLGRDACITILTMMFLIVLKVVVISI